MKTISLEQIRSVLPGIDVVAAMEEGFVAYSEGRCIVPPVGELLLEKGEVHIKYGCIKGDEFYVIKVASGFYGNAALGLPTGSGLMLLFNQETGELATILLDEGHLTDIRTAAAGAVAAKHLAPKNVSKIGIVGTGVQARLQLLFLGGIVMCRDVLVWGRGAKQLEEYSAETSLDTFSIETTTDAARIQKECDLIVTTTPSKSPLLFFDHLRPGTHITAVGSDTSEKQELESGILSHADIVVADSIAQCLERGEIFRALSDGAMDANFPIELGKVISGESAGRTDSEQITVADLTGVAVQDIKIAEAVYRELRSEV
ncbi:MAG: ornithine cyclodeaminase family protein [Pyrinomonadaceae bacterium]|nr:ornithine cyclodeaminase family protein [Pyrinomonadaceae bacterium]